MGHDEIYIYFWPLQVSNLEELEFNPGLFGGRGGTGRGKGEATHSKTSKRQIYNGVRWPKGNEL